MAQRTTDKQVVQGAQVTLAELPLTADELDRANRVDFRIDRDSEVPVGTQLGWKLHAMLARGVLRPGDRVPSVRELADFAGVNVNTARAVYRDLELEGLISSQQGRGTFVTAKADGLRELGELVGRTLAEARERGLDPKLLAASLYSEPPAGGTPLPEPLPEIDRGGGEPAMRRALREQIGMLEAELANYAWHDPHGAAPAGPRVGGPVGRIVGVEELERTRAELIDRLRRLRGEAAARGAREQLARGHVEAMLRDPSGHRWERVDNATLGEASCGEHRVVPAWGPVGAIMGWWRVKVSSGCP
jgi:DNA-binding transcriptional regulator YhcF (GntR family)